MQNCNSFLCYCASIDIGQRFGIKGSLDILKCSITLIFSTNYYLLSHADSKTNYSMTVTDCLFGTFVFLVVLLNPASGYTARKNSYTSTYPDTNPNLSYQVDIHENDTFSLNETEPLLNIPENITFPIPILVSNNNGVNSESPAAEDSSKEEDDEVEDVNLRDVESEDDLNTAATFIIGPPYNRPYSHYPINYFPSIWLQRPRYYYNHYRPRPVPYRRTHSYRG